MATQQNSSDDQQGMMQLDAHEQQEQQTASNLHTIYQDIDPPCSYRTCCVLNPTRHYAPGDATKGDALTAMEHMRRVARIEKGLALCALCGTTTTATGWAERLVSPGMMKEVGVLKKFMSDAIDEVEHVGHELGGRRVDIERAAEEKKVAIAKISVTTAAKKIEALSDRMLQLQDKMCEVLKSSVETGWMDEGMAWDL